MGRQLTTLILMATAAAVTLSAQEVLAPTPEQVGSTRGENIGPYNIPILSIRLSIRHGVRQRRPVSQRRQLRQRIALLGSTLTIDSKTATAAFRRGFADHHGAGRDPTNRCVADPRTALYRYDMNWRENQFFDPGVVISGGEHLMNTTRLLQDTT